MEAEWIETIRIAFPGPLPTAPSSPVTAFAFDTSQELLWTGNEFVSVPAKHRDSSFGLCASNRISAQKVVVYTGRSVLTLVRAASHHSTVLSCRSTRLTVAM